MMGTILSLYDYSGEWSRPWADSGYMVIQVDKQLDGQDVRLLQFKDIPKNITGLLAAPPCTHLAGSGARWWKEKGEAALIESLSMVDVVYRIIHIAKPEWWVLENPVGRLNKFVGEPLLKFHPYEFAGWADNPKDEAYTKKTLLWGNFEFRLQYNIIRPTKGSMMHTKKRNQNDRSKTPQGFARAFFSANNKP